MYIEKMGKILNAVSHLDAFKKESILETIEDGLKCFPEYVNNVVMMEQEIALARIKFEGEPLEFQDVVQRLDYRRRSSHLDLIDSINIINRICKEQLQIEPFFTASVKIGTNDTICYGVDKELDKEVDCRRMAADCAKSFVDELYYQGRARTQSRPEDRDIAYVLSKNKEIVPMDRPIMELAEEVLNSESYSIKNNSSENIKIEEPYR